MYMYIVTEVHIMEGAKALTFLLNASPAVINGQGYTCYVKGKMIKYRTCPRTYIFTIIYMYMCEFLIRMFIMYIMYKYHGVIVVFFNIL